MDQIFEDVANDENTHELAEATADDVVITQAQGEQIDDELTATTEEQIPYSRNFLAQRKTKRMQFWVEYFTQKQRDRFQRFINNGEEYRHHIEAIFVENGLPKELYYVGLIESGYYLQAKSHAAAVGPWQFIKGTGSRYGLKISNELDERQDLFKASRAAAMYFKDLHNIFSSWELALAAYNAGEYGIIRRIVKHGTRDFYELSKKKLLPSETINYVPKVLAAMHVINNAQKYGFTIPKKNKRIFDDTELRPIKKNVALSTVAQRLNVSPELLRRLNPELKQGKTPSRVAGTYFLRVPKGQYAYRLNDLESSATVAKVASPSKPETRKEVGRRTAAVTTKAKVQATPKTYRVKQGDTLISISRKFNTTPLALARANGFASWKTRVRTGQVLKLEASRNVASVATTPVKVTERPIVYQVKSGDNLTEISRVFGISIQSIKAANRLKNGRIMAGQKLVLPSTRKGIYTVQPGDHLTKLSQDFKLPLEALVKLNSIKRGHIYPGQKLIVDVD